jgi:hypothetical protein
MRHTSTVLTTEDHMKAGLLFVAALMIAPVPSFVAHAEAGCTLAPQAGCKLPFVAHQSTLRFAETQSDPDTIFTWRWRQGSQTTLGDFGDPLATTAYVLCLYDGSARAQPVVADAAEPQGWKALFNGFSYLVRGEHPLRKLVLRAGDDGHAKILGHGDTTTVQSVLPFTMPVLVQLQASNGQCWETDFATPARNDAHRFSATD